MDPSAAGVPGAEQRWLTRGVVGIGGASFFADVGHEIPTALPPSLLTTTLGPPAATLLILRATELLTPSHGRDIATQLALGLYIAYNTAANHRLPARRAAR